MYGRLSLSSCRARIPGKLRLFGLVMGLCVAFSALGVLPAGADTASELSAAQTKSAEAEAAYKAAASELSDINARYEGLGAQIDQLTADIKATEARVAQLKV